MFEEFTRLVGVTTALEAKCAERYGFEALWLSSLGLHTSARLPDADILGIAEYSAAVSKICDRVEIPLVVDGDCGGGSPINTIRMVREYEKHGAKGICIEDNVYPKRNSLYDTGKRELAEPKQHAQKLKAALDARKGDFVVIARIESFIAGLGLQDALERAGIYTEAGVDAILIHSKQKEPFEVFDFCFNYSDLPVVCVPTTYNQVTEDKLRKIGLKGVIYANAGMRAALRAIKRIFKQIAKDKTLANVEGQIAPLQNIWDLVAMDELVDNDNKYK